MTQGTGSNGTGLQFTIKIEGLDPKSKVTPDRWGADRIQGTRDGIDVTVDLYPSISKYAGKISIAYPTNTPVNP
ncbi:hypothetical protein [Photobacterium aquae]|uniref:hypothetical protein n=1 Tax=Photobacterium aquae TaxID=1195763 RepID=UPI000A9067A6|nr:hypothetical protein [Photobacterium aquae]